MKKFFLVIAYFLPSLLFAKPNLEEYLKNDLELKKLALEVKKAELSSKETSIDNGFAIKLSTGKLTLNSQGDDVNVRFTPQLTASVPQLNNLGVSVSSNIKITGGENNTENTTISLSADLISGNRKKRKAVLMKSERALLETKRKLQNRALEAEKEYYTELKKLFDSATSIVAAQKTLYDDTIDFEEIKAKGYTSSSSKYRQAELRVLSDKHNVETKIRELEHDCAVFASKCNTTFEEGKNPKEFLPDEIVKVEAIDVLSFEKDDYTKIESAQYTHNYNNLERAAQTNFSLTAKAGYTLNNSSAKTTGTANIGGQKVDTTSTNNTDTVDTGLAVGWNGLNLEAGVSFPVNSDSSNLIYTLSATFNPNDLLKTQITNKKNNYSEEEELLEIQKAEENYKTSIVDQQKSLADINWSKKTNDETYKMYVQLEQDMSKYLKQGVISQSEYLNAFANKEQYRLKLLTNDIELIIYNNTTKLLFCRDEEIQ